MADLQPGATLDGKYRILRVLGEGGMGVVFVAEHIFLRKNFALKLLRAELASSSEAAVRFAQEAQATSRLEHPNIVRVSDFGRTEGGSLYLVMELLTGRSLATVLAETPKVDPHRAQSIACQVLSALEAAHAQLIIHRDLKPENVFLCPVPGQPETVKLLDFGIAKLSGETDNIRLTTTGSVMGTPQYMAPEQARGVVDLDRRVDLHAVGAILYEMLAGRPVYSGENFHQVLAAILTTPPVDLQTLAPEVDPALCRVTMRALAKDRDKRYQNAAEFREALLSCTGLPAAEPLLDAPLAAEIVDAPLVTTAEVRQAQTGAHDAWPRQLQVTDLRAAAPTPSPQPILDVPMAEAPAPPAPQSDPFAPPDEVGERRIELASPEQRPSRPASLPAVGMPAYIELNAHKREAQATRGVRKAFVGLAVLLALGLLAAARNLFPPAPPIGPPPLVKASVKLDGLPEKSLVLLDGVRTLLNPIEMRMSGDTHELRIECEGYRSKRLWFVASSPQVMVDARLERLPPPKTARGRGRADGRTSLLAQ